MLTNKGFTLVEVVIAVLIIGLIMSMGVPAYINAVENASGSEGMSTLKSMYNAAFDYYAENDTFTGMGIAQLNTYSGANFANDSDWTYAVAVTDSTFTLTANRISGVNSGQRLVVNQDDDWSASTYPIP